MYEQMYEQMIRIEIKMIRIEIKMIRIEIKMIRIENKMIRDLPEAIQYHNGEYCTGY